MMSWIGAKWWELDSSAGRSFRCRGVMFTSSQRAQAQHIAEYVHVVKALSLPDETLARLPLSGVDFLANWDAS